MRSKPLVARTNALAFFVYVPDWRLFAQPYIASTRGKGIAIIRHTPVCWS